MVLTTSVFKDGGTVGPTGSTETVGVVDPLPLPQVPTEIHEEGHPEPMVTFSGTGLIVGERLRRVRVFHYRVMELLNYKYR